MDTKRSAPGSPGAHAAARQAPPLGQVLEEHIGAWIARLERPLPWTRRSDIWDRLLGEVEKIALRAAMEKHRGVQVDAADFLGLSRNTLARKLREHGLADRGPRARGGAGASKRSGA